MTEQDKPVIDLSTDRLLLRPAAPSDVDDLRALDADPEVMRYLGSDGATSADLVGTDGYWVAFERSSGAFVGWFGVGEELGYRIVQRFWGRGYATEGARVVLRWAFEQAGRTVVTAQTMTVNTGSRRVLAKLGMRHVRTFFVDWVDPLPGAEHGDVAYELTRQEWLAATAE